MLDVHKLNTDFHAMNLEELRSANRLLVGHINSRHKQTQTTAMVKFNTGDLVDFTDTRDRRRIRARIERINTKTMTVKETESPFKGWRVSPSMCSLVGAAASSTPTYTLLNSPTAGVF
jgi:hypothetical protein